MNENFFGQTANYVSSPHCAEASCQVSSKSLGWFSGKTVYTQTNGPTIPGLTSTDVENCNATSSGRLNVRSTSSACRTVQPVRRHGNMARWPDGILSKNLITSQSNKKDYRKWSTTSHMALWIIQKHILVTSA